MFSIEFCGPPFSPPQLTVKPRYCNGFKQSRAEQRDAGRVGVEQVEHVDSSLQWEGHISILEIHRLGDVGKTGGREICWPSSWVGEVLSQCANNDCSTAVLTTESWNANY